jgi:hypothetical protein
MSSQDFEQDEAAALLRATIAVATLSLNTENDGSKSGASSSVPSVVKEKGSKPKDDGSKKVEAENTPQPKASPKYDRWAPVDSEEKMHYGPFAADTCVPDKNKDAAGPTFYITTAINYTNGPAHMGHAYEATTSDCIARYARASGQYPGGVYFVTGADEHGQKIATNAEKEGKAPLEICNKYVTGFKALNHRIRISSNDYVRTTSDRHKRTAKEIWKKCAAAGDIYLDGQNLRITVIHGTK